MIKEILKQVQQGKLTVADAEKELATYEDLGFAKVDYHRKNVKVFQK